MGGHRRKARITWRRSGDGWRVELHHKTTVYHDMCANGEPLSIEEAAKVEEWLRATEDLLDYLHGNSLKLFHALVAENGGDK